jgi:MFS family permease
VGVAHAAALATACVLLVLIGVGAGFGNVNVVTLTQKNVSKAMMGRVMSLIVLAEVGLTPVSNALAGALADWNVTLMFVLAGGLLTLTTLLALLVPEVRVIEE